MNHKMWEKAVAFHGHTCPGLAIGVRASEAAIETLKITFSEDEDIVCITENDACGVDGVQAILGCTFGKGNLIYHGTGKQAFSFYNRTTGEGIRVYLKSRNDGRPRADYQKYLLEAPLEELFTFSKPKYEVPERARIFNSATCEICGEMVPEHKIHLQEGKCVCEDCFKPYTRGF